MRAMDVSAASDHLVEQSLRSWQAQLLDLSKSNPLLHFGERGTLQLVQPSAAQLFAALTSSLPREPIRLVRSATPGQVGVIVARSVQGAIPAALRAMRQRADTARVESGVDLLYAVFGLLRWDDPSEAALTSPLLLVPVRLGRRHVFEDYELQPLPAGEPVLNPAVVEKVAAEYGVRIGLPPGVASGLRLDQVFEHVRDSIAARAGWIVDETAYLGLFPFPKYVLYEDLKRQANVLRSHPIVRAIAGDDAAKTALARGEGRPAAEQDDDDDPGAVFQVLDADASQREAIDAINRGGSLIVQGPPGTGKSQTIANVIAESLAREKSVLFVSEKIAALNVVAARLANAGLDPFCLSLHDDALDEAAVVRELAKRTGIGIGAEDDADAQPDEQADALERLATTRNRLNEYNRALCDPGTPWKRSAYEVIGETAALAGAAEVRFDFGPDFMGALTPPVEDRIVGALDALVAVADLVTNPDGSPWSELDPALVGNDPVGRYQLRERLGSLQRALTALDEVVTEVQRGWSLPGSASIARAGWLRGLVEVVLDRGLLLPPASWFQAGTFERVSQTATLHIEGRAELPRRRAALLGRYSVALFDAPVLAALADVIERGQGPVLVTSDARIERSPVELPARFSAAVLLSELIHLREAALTIAAQLGLDPPATLGEADLLLRLARLVASQRSPLRAWYTDDTRARARELATQAIAHAAAAAERSELLRRFRPELFALATHDRIERLDEADDDLWGWVERVIHRDVARVEEVLTQPGDLDRPEAARILRSARAVAAAEAWFARHDDELEALLRHHYQGPTTIWGDVLDALDAVEASLPAVRAKGEPPAGLVDFPPRFARERAVVDELERRLRQTRSALAMLRETGAAAGDGAPEPETSLSLASLEGRLSGMLRPFPDVAASVPAFAEARHAPWTTFREIEADIREAIEWNRQDAELRSLIGPSYRGAETPWAEVLATLLWVGRIRRQFDDGAIGELFVKQALECDLDTVRRLRTALSREIDAVGSELDRCRDLFRSGSYLHQREIDGRPLAEVSAWVNGRVHAPEDALERWVRYHRAMADATDAGLGPFLRAATERRLAPDAWRGAFRLQLNTLWLSWRMRQAAALQLGGAELEALFSAFRELDRAQPGLAARRLRQRLRDRRRRALDDPQLEPERSALRAAAIASGQRLPLRTVLGRIPNLLRAVKPCCLMNPTAVAQFLGDSPVGFDVVVFDEASQVLIADAIGAIGRARQLVVVGDSQQLPPTAFFDTAGQTGTEAPGGQESLLDACNQAGLPTSWLRWHYRSRHEDLIEFSNREFYEHRLVTFASPNQRDDPIEFVHVANGVYERGTTRTNPEEARRVADLVVQHVRRFPSASLGVITFSQAQMLAVEEELDLRKRKDQSLEQLLDPSGPVSLFVRNLETAQGDERDVIILSVGYGPDEQGEMIMNFGPLNQQGGERRLNVAITRARQRMIVVASFLPERLGAAASTGAQLLRRYLQYARLDAAEPRDVKAVQPRTDLLEDAVAARLTAAGFQVERWVGSGSNPVSIALRGATGAHVLGIECDGGAYGASPVARDRERLRHDVLAGLGWRTHRIWSPDWLRNAEGEVAKIAALVETAAEQAATPIHPPVAVVEDAGVVPPSRDDGPPVVAPVDTAPPPAPPAATPPPGAPPAGADDDYQIDWGPDGATVIPIDDAGSGPPVTGPVATSQPPEPIRTPPPRPPDRSSPPERTPPAGPTRRPTAPTPTPPRDAKKQGTDAAGKPPRIPRSPMAPKVPAGDDDPRAPKVAQAPKAPKPPAGTSAGTAAKEPPRRERPLQAIRGLVPDVVARFAAAGLTSTDELVARGADARGRASLAREMGVPERQLLDWINRADLMRLKGIGTKLSDLLEECGVDSCRELRHRVPENLYQRLTEVNAQRKLVARLPTLAQVIGWIEQAKALDGEAAP